MKVEIDPREARQPDVIAPHLHCPRGWPMKDRMRRRKHSTEYALRPKCRLTKIASRRDSRKAQSQSQSQDQSQKCKGGEGEGGERDGGNESLEERHGT